MEYFIFMVRGVANTISRHRFLCFFMVVLVTCSLSILGLVMNQGEEIEANIADYSETYGKKNYYFTNDGLTDFEYYKYLEEKQQATYDKIAQFRKALLESKEIVFFNLVDQSVEICNRKMEDVFLVGYEEGNARDSIFDYEGKTYYSTKAIQVSDAFFREFDIKLAQGNFFEEEDYQYKEGKKIPILLGSKYKNIYKIGDVVECNYLFEKVTLEVRGFLQEDAFFYNSMNQEFEACERYIVMPALECPKADYFSRIMLLQQMEGMIVSDIGFPEVQKKVDDLLEQIDVGADCMYLLEPEATNYAAKLMKSYSSMTEEVFHQFRIILCLIFFFVYVSISTTLSGFIREKSREYGIQMLCGATPLQILGDILLLDYLTFMSGCFMAVIFLLAKRCSMKSVILIIFSAVVLGILIAVRLFYCLYKLNISEIIGGKE